jgi:hypothetical protein
MADKQSRDNFIATLKEVADIAESCGEQAAQGTILILMAALNSDHELEFFSHACKFAERERDWLIARQAQREGKSG